MLIASGMPQPTDPQCGRSGPPTERVWVRYGALVGAWLLLATTRCTFPEYETGPSAGGVPGVGGAGATVSGGGAGGLVGGTQGTLAGAGNEAGAASPECAPEQWPVEHCKAGCLRHRPDHCYDGETSGDEVAADCGGSCQGCTLEPCTSDDDCLSSACVAGANGSACAAPLSVTFAAHETSPVVGSTSWSIKLGNDEPAGGKAYAFKGLKLRYYFDRSSIVEPLLVRATQSNLRLATGESSALGKTSWLVEREERTPKTVYDAYVEVGFGDAGELFPGDQIDLYQQMLTGDPGRSTFDQRANYSYTGVPQTSWLRVTVFYQGKLLWGLEPLPANPRACFARGVNLNGPAVVIDQQPWEAAAEAMVTSSGSSVSQGSMPFPTASGGLATMLTSATRLQAGNELSLPTENGTYLLYLYAASPGTDAEASLLTVQGLEPDSSSAFRAQAADGGQAWARLGPYRVDVTTGKLTVGVSKGGINFTGLALWYRH